MKHIDDLFKEELGGYAEMPPPPAWGALEKRLEEDKRRRAFPYRWFWVVGLIAFVAISGYGVANKLAAERMASTAGPLPVPAQSHISAVEQNTTSAKKETIVASSITKTSVRTSNNLSHHTKRTKHITHNTNDITSSRESIAATAVETLSATVKTTNISSQYPSEEDVYEGAVASTAPLAYESTTPTGYTVNRRKKHNMVVADMSPVPEQQKHYASATEPSRTIDAPAADNIPAVETARPKHKAINIVSAARAVVTTSASQPGSHTIKTATKPAINTVAVASATPKVHSTSAHSVKVRTTPVATLKQVSAKHIAISNAQTQPVVATAPIRNVKMTTTKAVDAKPATTAAIASTATTSIKQGIRKSAATAVHNVAKQSANVTIVAAAPASTPAIAHAETATSAASATLTGDTQKKVAKANNATANIEATLTTTPAPTAKAHKSTAKVAVVASTEKAASAKQTGTHAPVVSEAVVGAKQSPVLAAAPSTVSKVSTRTALKPSTETAAVTKAQTTPVAKSNTEISVTPADVSKVGSTPGLAKVAKKISTKHSNHPTAKTTKSAISAVTAATATTGKTTKSTQKSAQRAPVMLAAKASTPKAAKTQPAYKFTPSIEEDAPSPAIDNLRTESTVAAAGNTETPIPATFKATTSEQKDVLASQQEQKSPMLSDSTLTGKRKRFEAGIKAGFEGSIMSGAANKFVISPYLDYKLSPKFSVLLQPAIKSSMLATHSLSGTQTFYNAHPGDSTLISSAPGLIYNNATHTWDTLFTVRKYGYQQSHDSVVKSYNVGGTYLEFELPILLKYAINEKLSVYGGVNIAYSRMIRINEKTFNSGPITLVDTQAVVSPKGQYVAPPTIAATFTYSGQPLSNYAGPLYPASSEGLIRLGYMLGFSYEFKKRWMVDALVQQCFAKPNEQGGYNTNTALSLPYMRLTLGYKLTK